MPLRIKPERKEEKDRTREELLRAALRLGAAHGFSSLGLREVAREALIAPTSFYRHFEDMEALGLAIVQDKVEPFMLGWARGASERGSEPETLVDMMFRAVDAEPDLARFLLAERVGSSAALRGALREASAALGHALLDAVAITKRSRALLDAVDLATVVLFDAAAQLLDASAQGRAPLRQLTLERLESAVAMACGLERGR